MKRVGRSFTKSKGISYNKKEKTIAFQESITDTQQLSVVVKKLREEFFLVLMYFLPVIMMLITRKLRT